MPYWNEENDAPAGVAVRFLSERLPMKTPKTSRNVKRLPDLALKVRLGFNGIE
jgi:hypothetical protein